MIQYIIFNILLAINFVLSSDISDLFYYHRVVPDVILQPPRTLAQVEFQSGVSVCLGDELTPTQVKDKPRVIWNAEPNSYYTVMLIDVDAPSRQNPEARSFVHWLVVNIPGCDITRGQTLAYYFGSGPPKGSGLHRYVYLIYKQPGLLDFGGLSQSFQQVKDRGNFSCTKFAEEYKLGCPVAGNFYQAQFDDYVPILHKKLGL